MNFRCFSTQPAKQLKVTLERIRKLYANKEPIIMMTAHDYPSGMFCQESGTEICLVGDSLAMVALGHDSTLQITLDEMIHHARSVKRSCTIPFIVGDLPFGSYEISPAQACASAIRFVKEGMVEAVKLEGGIEMVDTVEKISSIGIPVLGHIGLTPQRASSLSGFRAQGRTIEKVVYTFYQGKGIIGRCFSNPRGRSICNCP
jgi:3-methyl-2-oxobutanoate hydroxymethyltransferase